MENSRGELVYPIVRNACIEKTDKSCTRFRGKITYSCPNQHCYYTELPYFANYCPKCGQKMKWHGEHDNTLTNDEINLYLAKGFQAYLNEKLGVKENE